LHGLPEVYARINQHQAASRQEFADAEGTKYYYNAKTGLTQWDRPAELEPPTRPEPPAPRAERRREEKREVKEGDKGPIESDGFGWVWVTNPWDMMKTPRIQTKAFMGHTAIHVISSHACLTCTGELMSVLLLCRSEGAPCVVWLRTNVEKCHRVGNRSACWLVGITIVRRTSFYSSCASFRTGPSN